MSDAGVDDLLELITARDRQRVIDTVVELTERAGLDAVITLLGAVQREVGVRWLDRTWSVADEHVATSTVDFALAAAALRVPTPNPTRGTVVVACAEEEWHVLPARMLGEQLRARAWDVTFLGASTPADHLGAYLAKHRPLAAAVSCSVPLYLPGARRSVEASHAAGVPVVVGGEGFGGTNRRAVAIGADAWARTADETDVVLTSWAGAVPAFATPADDAAQRELSFRRPVLVDEAMTVLAELFPPLATYSSWQRAKTVEDLDYILRFVEAAVLTGDDNIAIDFAEWLTRLLLARGLPESVVPLSVDSLLSCMPRSQPAARRLLELAKRTATAR